MIPDLIFLYWMIGAGALGRPGGMVQGGRRVRDGEHVYACGRSC